MTPEQMEMLHRYSEEVAELLTETQEKLDSAKAALWMLRRITIDERDGGIDSQADERSWGAPKKCFQHNKVS